MDLFEKMTPTVTTMMFIDHSGKKGTVMPKQMLKPTFQLQ